MRPIEQSVRRVLLVLILMPFMVVPATQAQGVIYSGSLQSESCLVIASDELYIMSSDETWDCVKVKGTLRTNGHILTITGDNGLKIIPSGSLEITEGQLTLAGDGKCTINGQIIIGTGYSTLRVVGATIFTGSGQILGAGGGARVEIAATGEITNKIRFAGGMDIIANEHLGQRGYFINMGVVRADILGESIAFSSSTILTDSGIPNADDFMALNGGKLIFYRGVMSLASTFTSDDLGILIFHSDICTTGDLVCTPDSIIFVSIDNHFSWGDPTMTIDHWGSPYYGCP